MRLVRIIVEYVLSFILNSCIVYDFAMDWKVLKYFYKM